MSLPAEVTAAARRTAAPDLIAEIRAADSLALLELKREFDRAVARDDYERARMYAFALAARLRRVKLARAAA